MKKRPRATPTRHFAEDGETINDYPHEGACHACRAAQVCNVCGCAITRSTRCTNGRCRQCDASVCTPGGSTSPGHGFGSHEDAVAACSRRNA